MNGAPILASELEQRFGTRLARLRQEEYEIRRQVLDELIGERLVAAEAQLKGVKAETLLQQEVDGKAVLPSDAQVRGIYEQHKARFGSASREEAIARIRQVLSERAISERRGEYLGQLRSGARVAVRLEPPRVTVEIPAGAPSTGPETAKVTIVEFTDYQCPYCHRAQSVIDEVLQRYSGQVRFVHLDYPLEGHAEAVPAARAARCAAEQGKFWEYHRSLMARLVGSFLTVSLLTVGFVAIYAFSEARSALRHAVVERLQATAAEREAALNGWVERRRASLIFIAKLTEVRETDPAKAQVIVDQLLANRAAALEAAK